MDLNNKENIKIVDFESLDDNIKKVIETAVEYRKRAYAQYSNFPVGACLQCDDNSLFGGCNVENAVYGLSYCAERTAMVKAISEGKKKFKYMAVVADQEKAFTTPCGPCRQFMAEFGTDIVVYITRSTLGKVMVATVDQLLPYSFSF